VGVQIHSLCRVEAEVGGVHGVGDDLGMAAEGDGDREAAVDHANQDCRDPVLVATGHSC
jgi:phosphomannomutase